MCASATADAVRRIARPALKLPCRLLAGALLSLCLLLPAAAAWAQQSQVGIVHTWTRIYYGELDGKQRLLFGGGFERAKPALGDLDGDGDLDLLVGVAKGRVLYFENRGSPKAPRWRLISEGLPAAQAGAPRADPGSRRVINVGGNAAPALADIDGDDDLDLFVGSAGGKLHFFRNTGNRYLPSFRMENPNFLGADFGRNLVPRFGDVNRDALPDLALGNAEGVFYLLVNQGSRALSRFCVQPKPVLPDCLRPAQRLGRLDPEDDAVPAWVDWDADGDLDLMVGKSDGKIAYYRNIGNSRNGSWELAASRFKILDGGGYAAPLFRDVNGDGRPDLLLAGDGDRIAYYLNRPADGGGDLWLQDRNLLRIVRLGQFQSRLHTASGDLNGDGRPDLVIGTRGGRLLIYENRGRKGKVVLRSTGGPLLPTPQRSFSAPVLADLDGDKDLDLVVGGRAGRLEFIQNSGTRKKPRWKITDLFYAQIDVGAMSSPVFYDLDGDGDLDLLVGNSLGKVVYYLNGGTPKQAQLTLQSIGFSGIKVDGAATPTFFTFDPKAPPELVVGGRSGRLVSAVRNPALKVVAPRGYLAQPVPWQVLASRSHSAPHFVDLTGDGRVDLLLGGGDGTLSFWRYEGSRRPRTVAAQPRPPGGNIVPPPGSRLVLTSPTSPPPGGESGEREKPPALPETELVAHAMDPVFEPGRGGITRLAPGRSSRPAFMDVNADGRADLIVGNRAGHLLLYRNVGGRGAPRWQKITESYAGYRHGHNATPVVYDVDGDGDQDLAVGTEKGRVYYWENTAGKGRPKWRHRPRVFGRVRTGNNAVPAFTDLDGDGRADLLVGSLRGHLSFYRRLPGPGLRFKLHNRRYMGVDVGVNSSPGIGGLVDKENPVLLVGSDRGRITVLVSANGGAADASVWRVNKSFLEGLKMPLGSHPVLADLDGDGDLDLYVGSDAGPIRFFRNNARVSTKSPR